MKMFVSKPDATELAHKLSDMWFLKLSTKMRTGRFPLKNTISFLYKASSNMTEKMIRHLFHVADKNGDGVIQKEEFQESTAKLLLSTDYD